MLDELDELTDVVEELTMFDEADDKIGVELRLRDDDDDDDAATDDAVEDMRDVELRLVGAVMEVVEAVLLALVWRRISAREEVMVVHKIDEVSSGFVEMVAALLIVKIEEPVCVPAVSRKV